MKKRLYLGLLTGLLLVLSRPLHAQVRPAAPGPEASATPAANARINHSSTYTPRQPDLPPALGGPSGYQPIEGLNVQRLTRPVEVTPTPTPIPISTPKSDSYLNMVGRQFGRPASQPAQADGMETKSQRKTAAASKPVVIRPPDNDTYVAVVDNRFLRKSEMDYRVNRLLLMTDQIGWKDKNARESMRSKIENMVLTEWIDLTLLAVSSEKEGFTVTEAEVQEKLNEIYQQEQNNPGLQSTLQAVGMSRTELLENLHDALLTEKLVNKHIQERLSEKDLKEIYQHDPQAFMTPVRAELNYMVLRLSGKETLEQRRKLKDQMDIWQKKAAKRDKFMEVAKQFNQPELGQMGGNFGWANPRSLPRQASSSGGGKSAQGGIQLQDRDKIVEAVFALKPGEVSKVQIAETGFYIFQMIRQENGSGAQYETAKSRVQNAVYEEAKKAEIVRAATQHTLYLNAGGLDFDAIAKAKLSGKDLEALREQERKQKFMEHFRDRLLAAEPSGKTIVQREATSAPAEVSQKSLDILKKFAAEHPERFAAP